MTRRERLMSTLEGKSVDRPPVSFYELNGLDENPDDKNPFNIYSHPSWKLLMDLTREKTDRIVMRGISFKSVLPDPIDDFAEIKTSIKNKSRYTIKTVKSGKKTLTSKTRQDKDVNTIWTEEHLLKNVDDLKAFLEIPLSLISDKPDLNPVLLAEEKISDTGIVMIDTPDPLCLAASLFSMEDYMIIAMTEEKLIHRLLEKFQAYLQPRIDLIAKELPNRLWRIYGPEYASPPYLPPHLFREYVVKYDKPIVDVIQKYGGFARIHSHGKLKDILTDILSTGCKGLDPIEPPPNGDVSLKYVKKNYGKDLVLFGNLEVSDIENLSTDQFEEKVYKSLNEGTSGNGKGFVLMPSACPYGRELSSLTLKNYEKIVECVENF